jgi:smad nuclear-interacting protein 1
VRDRYRSRSRERSHRKRSYSPEDTSSRSHRQKRSRRSEDDSHRDSHRKERRRSRPRSQSPAPAPKPFKRLAGALPDQASAFNTEVAIAAGEDPPIEKQKPNFAPTGKLAAEANTVKQAGGAPAIILKYHEPAEARKPPTSAAWRMYVFKGTEIMDTIPLATQSCWLFGREASVVDYLIEHPSASKQHAVLQFRHIERTNEFGDRKGRVRPYVIDLESANGTMVNGERVPEGRYVEVKDGDVLGFGLSTRDYVVQLPPAG